MFKRLDIGAHEGWVADIKKVPSPYGTIFISRNDTCFPVPEASTTAVRSVGVPGKVIQQFSGNSIHEADVPI